MQRREFTQPAADLYLLEIDRLASRQATAAG
jgi:hypothetical protein